MSFKYIFKCEIFSLMSHSSTFRDYNNGNISFLVRITSFPSIQCSFIPGSDTLIFLWRDVFLYHLGFYARIWTHWGYVNEKHGLYRKISAYKIARRARTGVKRTLLCPSYIVLLWSRDQDAMSIPMPVNLKQAAKQWVFNETTRVDFLPLRLRISCILFQKTKLSKKMSFTSSSSSKTHSNALHVKGRICPLKSSYEGV